MNIQLMKGDCLKQLKKLKDNSVDSVVTDPPYGIGFMGKAWDTFDTKNVEKANKDATKSYKKTKDTKQDNPNLKGRKNAPIGGKATFAGTYDLSSKGTLQYQKFCEEWGRECLRVLKPGGHLLSSCSPRMYHRMTVGLEDAGFEIRDQIMWVYGSGFPKSHNIGKAVDKLQGNEREVVGDNPNHRESDALYELGFQGGKGNGTITKGNSPYEGWGTALKPAHEPIVMARKPFKGSVAQNVLEYGTGGININDCRVGTEKVSTHSNGKGNTGDKGIYGTYANQQGSEEREGRFPANFIIECTCENPIVKDNDKEPYKYKDKNYKEDGFLPNVNAEAPYNYNDTKGGVIHTDPNCPCRILDEQSGTTKSSKRGAHNNKKTEHTNTYTPPEAIYGDHNTYGDTGGASRFFYCPKASKKDRDEGVEYKGQVLKGRDENQDKLSNPFKLRPSIGATYAGNQTTSKIGANPNKPTQPRANIHPTVKPTDLMAYLVRMVTPKGGTVLDPFMGSGSTGKAAIREGMDFIGIEREDEYMEIAKTRIEHEKGKHNYRQFFDI